MSDDQTALQVADHLLQIKAIQLQPQNPFQWSSGWSAPIYCDNRRILSYPNVRQYITNQFTKKIREETSDQKIDVIAGVATSGIPFGMLVADRLDLPFVYVRPKPKKHGLGRQIEGEVPKGQKVFVIEDLISTGKSSLKVVHTLKESGCTVVGLGAIFSYNFDVAKQNFAAEDCTYFTLSDYKRLIRQALESGLIHQDTMNTLQDWRKSPETWGQKQP